MKKVFISSDHAGFELKKALMASLLQVPWEDLGTHSTDSVDYPDQADVLCRKLLEETQGVDTTEVFGVLICGSGQGMAMRANRYAKIRAALCWNPEITRLSREHNSANVLVLPGRFINVEQAQEFFKIFSETPFAGGRHQSRVNKLGSSC